MRCGSCRASGAPSSSRSRIGTLDERQYDEAVGDLVAYLQWMGEPAQGTRIRIGVGVLVFLGLLVLITWRLSSAYWRTVH